MYFSVKNITIFLSYVFCILCAVTYEKIKFFAVERPLVEYTNPKFISFANMSARRYNRYDPVYYFNLHFRNVYAIGNNNTFHFYFYEFLSNMYKPSFVEIHVKGCDLLEKEPVFGGAIKRALKAIKSDLKLCPLPPGDYDMQNCTLNAGVLRNFPFPKGRIYANLTLNPTGELYAGGYVDFEIKEVRVKKRT